MVVSVFLAQFVCLFFFLFVKQNLIWFKKRRDSSCSQAMKHKGSDFSSSTENMCPVRLVVPFISADPLCNPLLSLSFHHYSLSTIILFTQPPAPPSQTDKYWCADAWSDLKDSKDDLISTSILVQKKKPQCSTGALQMWKGSQGRLRFTQLASSCVALSPELFKSSESVTHAPRKYSSLTYFQRRSTGNVSLKWNWCQYLKEKDPLKAKVKGMYVWHFLVINVSWS